MKEKEQEFFYLLPFLNKNKIIIITVPLASALLAMLLTSFIKPKYHSSAIVFPTAGNSIGLTLENPNFGYDIEADRLIQILQSTELMDSIASKFELVKYYELDTTEAIWKDLLYERIRKDVSFERTRYMSIEIAATTKDPVMSAAIVNTVLATVDRIRDRIYKKNMAPAVNTLNVEYQFQRKKSDSLLTILNEKGNFKKDFLFKKDDNGQYTLSLGIPTDIQTAQQVNQYLYEQKRALETYSLYEKAKDQLSRPLPSVYVVNKAVPSYRKVSPSYFKNMLLAFTGTLMICILLLYIRDELVRKNNL